jgi:septum formation protein
MNHDEIPRLFLASQSPRRRQILGSLGLAFEVVASVAQEDHPHALQVETVTQQNALRKAKNANVSSEGVILGADTLVVLGDEVLGKPTDADEIRRMLGKLSANTHTVVTGIALVSSRWGTRVSAMRSHVTFRRLPEREIEEYLLTREPYDKAGSYAVQGLGSLFIDRIDGSYTNVMGLPIELLLPELAALTHIPLYRWFAK